MTNSRSSRAVFWMLAGLALVAAGVGALAGLLVPAHIAGALAGAVGVLLAWLSIWAARLRTAAAEEQMMSAVADAPATAVEVASGLGDAVRHRGAPQLIAAYAGMSDAMRSISDSMGRFGVTAAVIAHAVGSSHDKAAGQVADAAVIRRSSDGIRETLEAVTTSAEAASEAAGFSLTASAEGDRAVGEALVDIRSISTRTAETVKLIESLHERSSRVMEVAGVIESIAAQTNLLALNAAIEAARAGEHGRGFAVVAEEVRELASRTSSATTEVGAIVDGIRSETADAARAMEALAGEVNAGVERVEAVSASLGEIRQRSDTVQERVAFIVDTSRECAGNAVSIAEGVAAMCDGVVNNEQALKLLSDEASRLSGMSEEVQQRLAVFPLGGMHDTVYGAARAAAARIGAAFETALDDRRITEQALFSEQYERIPRSEPAKYRTPFDRLTDELLPAIQEPMLAQDKRLSFAIATDRRGYVPTHNNAFCKPLTGDPAKDLAGNRTKRIFDDPTGSRCGSHTLPLLLQTYKRDTGEVMHDLSVPIHVRGRHWGGFRVGYSAGD